jgi:hypothetical protein
VDLASTASDRQSFPFLVAVSWPASGLAGRAETAFRLQPVVLSP